jgi:heme/copper-type cytochrome/quinol oxidase subunit 2
MLTQLKLFSFVSIFDVILNDAPHAWQIGFQDSAAPGYTGIVELHNTILFYLIVIAIGVFWVLLSTMHLFSANKSNIVYKYLNHGTILELVWTITPALILMLIAYPSFRLLYILDEVISPSITIKVVGHQWYWSSIPIESNNLFNITYFSTLPIINKVSNLNHDKTHFILSQGINHPSIGSEVRNFLEQNKDLKYPYLFSTGDLGKIISLGPSYQFNVSNKKLDIKDKAGIYMIRIITESPATSNQFYIGSAINLLNRFAQHKNKSRFNSNQKGSIKLYSAIREISPFKLSF